ncbi:unnamed protein product, partial [marine sediment metagenome]
MRARYVLAVVVVVCGLLLVWHFSLRGANGESFIIAWNYDTSGYLEPCGCSAHLLGGLPRRATKIA